MRSIHARTASLLHLVGRAAWTLLFTVVSAAQPIDFSDDFESDTGWRLFEEVVGGNPCYGEGIGEMARVADIQAGNQALRLWADKAGSNRSNHLIAYNRLSHRRAVRGRYAYSFRVFLDRSGMDSQTGPELSLQNTIQTSPVDFATIVAAIQHQSNRFLSPAGPWAIWTQMPDGSPGWKPLFVQPLRLGAWYSIRLEADFLRNRYISFSIAGPSVNRTFDLREIPLGRADNLFFEETFDITLEAENIWSNCGDPAYASDSKIYYDDVTLGSIPAPREQRIDRGGQPRRFPRAP